MAHPSGVKLRFSRDKATGWEFVAWEQRGKRPEGPARGHSVPVQAAREPEVVGLLSGAGAPSPAENPLHIGAGWDNSEWRVTVWKVDTTRRLSSWQSGCSPESKPSWVEARLLAKGTPWAGGPMGLPADLLGLSGP